MIIPAGVSELRQAFHTHLGAFGQIKSISSHLLLFYAAECGLKSIWLRRNKLKTINDIADQTLISQDGHNLDRWIKETMSIICRKSSVWDSVFRARLLVVQKL
jgi:hypothetical protein